MRLSQKIQSPIISYTVIVMLMLMDIPDILTAEIIDAMIAVLYQLKGPVQLYKDIYQLWNILTSSHERAPSGQRSPSIVYVLPVPV